MSNWFGIKILMKAYISNNPSVAVMEEESIRLIQAENSVEAEEVARRVGIDAEHSYQNEDGDDVCWKFDQIIEVQDLCEEKVFHGLEVFSVLKDL